MCKQCKRLKNVDADKKSTVTLKDTNSIDAKEDKIIMQLNHAEDGKPYAFIAHHLTIDSTGRSYNTSIPIFYCPYCGEPLIN